MHSIYFDWLPLFKLEMIFQPTAEHEGREDAVETAGWCLGRRGAAPRRRPFPEAKALRVLRPQPLEGSKWPEYVSLLLSVFLIVSFPFHWSSYLVKK